MSSDSFDQFDLLIELEQQSGTMPKVKVLMRALAEAEARGRMAERAALEELRGMAAWPYILGQLKRQHETAAEYCERFPEAANEEGVYPDRRDALAALLRLLGGET